MQVHLANGVIGGETRRVAPINTPLKAGVLFGRRPLLCNGLLISFPRQPTARFYAMQQTQRIIGYHGN
jgi:hypothetical protein